MSAATSKKPGPRGLPDRLLGVVGGGMIALAVVLAFTGTGAEAVEAPAVPAIVLVEPTDGGSVPGRVPLLFHVDAEMRPLAGGWGVGDLHLHAQLDGTELMPAVQEIERAAEGRYRWVIGPLPPGPHAVRLAWSDAAHRAVEGGASATIRITVQ